LAGEGEAVARNNEPPAARIDEAERRDRVRLARSENVGPTTYHTLLDRFGSAAAALEALPELSARGGLKRPIRICNASDAEAELARAARLGLQLVVSGERGYPPLLAHIDAAPPLLYIAGQQDVLARPMIAVVGARNCSAAGRRLADRIVAGLAEAGLVIVSGLARGIDAAAHRASLATGTVAVLAGGHGQLYPEEHRDLAREIARAGALVSELPPDWQPRARDFPRRNRIIAGLAHGVVILEAAMRSGSLITARRALEQGREIFAVPGSPLDPRSDGANRLIRQGAVLTRSADDVLEALEPVFRRPPGSTRLEEPRLEVTNIVDLDDARGLVTQALGTSPVEIDEVTRHTGLPAGTVMQVLVELELAGQLERHPGQRVSLV
jgi:DNA processing protein